MKPSGQREGKALTMPLTDSTPPISPVNQDVSESDISRRAYERCIARGAKHGHHLDDWLEAERELQQLTTSQVASVS